MISSDHSLFFFSNLISVHSKVINLLNRSRSLIKSRLHKKHEGLGNISLKKIKCPPKVKYMVMICIYVYLC